MKHHVSRIVPIPVVAKDPGFLFEPRSQAGTRIWCQNVESRGLDPVRKRKIHGPVEHRWVIVVHAEHEARIDHYPERVELLDGLGVARALVLPLSAELQVVVAQRLEAYEQTAQADPRCELHQPRGQDRAHRGGCLPDPVHAAHSAQQFAGKARAGEQMIVEEEQVTTR